MNIKVIPFDEKFLVDFEYTGVEAFYTNGHNIKDIAVAYSKLGDAYMCLIDDKLVAMGGIYPVWLDPGQAWLFLNRQARCYLKPVWVAIKNHFEAISRRKAYKHITIVCLKDSREARCLVEHLNFNVKAEMLLYSKTIGEPKCQ